MRSHWHFAVQNYSCLLPQSYALAWVQLGVNLVHQGVKLGVRPTREVLSAPGLVEVGAVVRRVHQVGADGTQADVENPGTHVFLPLSSQRCPQSGLDVKMDPQHLLDYRRHHILPRSPSSTHREVHILDSFSVTSFSHQGPGLRDVRNFVARKARFRQQRLVRRGEGHVRRGPINHDLAEESLRGFHDRPPVRYQVNCPAHSRIVPRCSFLYVEPHGVGGDTLPNMRCCSGDVIHLGNGLRADVPAEIHLVSDAEGIPLSRLDRKDGHTIKVGQTFYKVFGMPFGFPRLSLREVYELEGPGPRATTFELP